MRGTYMQVREYGAAVPPPSPSAAFRHRPNQALLALPSIFASFSPSGVEAWLALILGA